MRMAFCESCKQQMGYPRALGWGTFFAILLTLGLWLLVLPFYPLRCIGCGQSWKLFTQPTRPPEGGRGRPSDDVVAPALRGDDRTSLAYRFGAMLGKIFRKVF